MNSYLFLLSIGPVQSFIAQSRKTQDLYESSRLLSELCHAGIEYVLDKLKNQADCIFPSDPKAKSIPNRFLIQLNLEDKINLSSFAKEVEEYIQAYYQKRHGISRLACFYDKTLNGSLKQQLRFLKTANITKQIEQLLDIQWVTVPIEKDYKSAYILAEQLIGNVKNARPFQQLEETGRKCSVCGIRNVRFYRCTHRESNQIFDKHSKEDLEQLRYRKLFQEEGSQGEAAIYPAWNSGVKLGLSDLQTGEGLCAVCAAKRFNMGNNFPSTAQIALMDTFEKGTKLALKAILDFKNCFSIGKQSIVKTFNWQFFYEENISSRATIHKTGFPLGKRYEGDNPQSHFQDIQTKHLVLSQVLRQHGLPLQKYYSLVLFDGDRMGDWLAGSKLKPGTPLENFHKSLSKLLSDYAKWVNNTFNYPQGRVVYAGGDDLMLLVNLQYLYPVLDQLREGFEEQVHQPLKAEFADQLKEKLTLSAGVLIAHYKTPLNEVLKQARRLEKVAKRDGRRNALAMGLLQRTGSLKATYWPWYYQGKKTIDLLIQSNQLLRKDKLSDTFARNFFRFIDPIMDQDGALPFEKSRKFRLGYLAMMKSELKRLLIRAKGPQLEKAQLEHYINDLLLFLANSDVAAVLTQRSDSNEQVWQVQNFLRLLEIILFMSNHTILEPEPQTADAQ